ncbi:MAG: nickel-dependent hydrogenase large subunit, partial [Rhodoferax sp.]|nr:nickel-dependent hydrogenase large subunit [Rhodoferax sp.]
AWQTQARDSDLALFLEIADDAQLNSMGAGPGRFMSYGAYANSEGGQGFAQGLWMADTARVSALDAALITEDPRHAWLNDAQGPQHPLHGLTQPQADKPGAYTWNKAPRLAGRVVETGAIARQLVDGQALVRAAVAQHGASVGTRVLARLMEVARVIPLMEQWLAAIEARAPFHSAYQLPEHGQGVGLSEAARGALGHWLRIEHGKLSSYQIVAPTSWNFSPRDAHGVPGALEAALVGTPVGQDGEAPGESVAVQHIVRSFDPCMVCTVH